MKRKNLLVLALVGLGAWWFFKNRKITPNPVSGIPVNPVTGTPFPKFYGPISKKLAMVSTDFGDSI